MGGGSSFSPSRRDAGRAEGIFRSSVREVEESTSREKIRNVFISFHTDDESQVNLLRHQAASERFDLKFNDYSIKEPFDEKWKSQCREKIALTSATICMIGPDTASRPSVIWELEESYRQGKKVAGVRINSTRADPLPQPLKDHNAPILPWKQDAIQKFLQEP